MRYLVLVLLLMVAQLVSGADYVREKKWADEITPGIVVGDPVYLEEKAGHKFLTIYTAAPNAQAGLVIVHGIGVHPDWGLINTLRSALADHGYTTLSVQMPVLAGEANAEDYRSTFGEAAERLQVAVDFLQARGYKKIAIVSHSMGSRMTRAYLTSAPSAPINAWVCIGLGVKMILGTCYFQCLTCTASTTCQPCCRVPRGALPQSKIYHDRSRSWHRRQTIFSTTSRPNSSGM